MTGYVAVRSIASVGKAVSSWQKEMWNYIGECIWGAQSHSIIRGKEKRRRDERDVCKLLLLASEQTHIC